MRCLDGARGRALRSRPAGAMPAAMLLAAAALAGLLGAAPARADRSRIGGKVVDADTQAPIAEARVELANTSGGQGFFRAVTSGKGEFQLQGIAPDRWYSLTVSAEGYADFVIGAWQIPAAQRAAELVIPLDRAGTIEVKLTHGDAPVVNARVSVQSERGETWWEGYRAPPAPLFTGRDGIARFTGLTAGFWTVAAEASGLRAGEARRVAVRRGEVTEVPLRLVKPASLAGTVRLADGTGVPGLTVTARGPAEGAGTSGTDGAFVLPDLAPGKYRVEVTNEGFEPAAAKESYSLREGESRDGVSLTVTPRPAELSFVLEREAFAPDAPVKLGLRSFRIGLVDLALHRIPNAELVDPIKDFRRFSSSSDTTGLTRVLSWQHETAAGPPWSWREEEIAVPETIPPGAYVLRGRAGELERRAIFFVTDLGILVKRAADRVLVSAATLRTGQPAPGARVFLTPSPGPGGAGGTNWSGALTEGRTRGRAPAGTTDADGMLLASSTGRTPRLRVVAVGDQGVAVADSPIAPAAEQGGDQAYLYTDRPIYRPGHTVNWKLFARKASGDGYALPGATTVTLTLGGPDGSTLPVSGAVLSAHGSADGKIELPRELALGDWALRVTAGSASSTASFAVQEYRKPEFAVEVTPDREVYVNGDEVRFRIAASYFFGAPVFGATVRYNLFESRLAREPASWEGEDDEGTPQAGYGRVLKTGETRSDLDGRAEVTLTPERVAYDRRLTLEVEVIDPSSRVVSGRGSAVMGRGMFAISVRPVSHVAMVGEPVPIEVSARDHTGRPVAAAVTVELDQEAWNPLERRYTRSTRPLASVTVTTDSLGRALVRLSPTPARSGPLIVRGRAEDAKGNRITDETTMWVYDARVSAYAYRYPALEAFADRDRYQPGDTARVVVNTDVRDAQVLATLEGHDLYERRVVSLAGNTGLIAFPIRPEYAPNAFVSLHVRKGKEVQSRVIELGVEAGRHDLAIELAPDREQYRPGDTGRIRIQTRDARGAGIPAEVSVAVVDEAIFQLRADNTPDPHQVFYGKRPNWVTTVVSFPVLYYGGADKGGRGEVRRDFRDVALWEPSVATDAQGRAEVAVRYPDNLTTWRVTSRGLTDATLVGKAVAKTLVTKEVVARLAGPRFFVAGDEASLVSVVTNRGGSPLVGVEESIEAHGPVALAGKLAARTSIPARGESRSEWPMKVPAELPREANEPAEAVFTFRARTKTDSDALEVRVPERPRAVMVLAHGAGLLEGAREAVTVALPANLIRAGSEAVLDFSPSPAAMALSALDFLITYPYGCTEQTADAILPAAELLMALRAGGVELPGWGDPSQRLGPFLQRLATLQGGDGGWGWWQGGDSDPFLTVLAMDALAHAIGIDAAPSSSGDALQRGFGRLPRVMAEVRNLDGEAYVCDHLVSLLALENAADRFPQLRERLEELALAIYTSREQLGTSGLALAAHALAALGQRPQARTLLDLLSKRAERDGTGLHWPPDPGFENAWFGEDVENTAYALSALVAVTPEDGRAAEVVRWLARRRTGLAWRSTRMSAPVAEALARYLGAHPGEVKPQYRLLATWNGEQVLDRAVTPADVFGAPELRVRIPGARLKPGANPLVITKEGPGSTYFGWEARALVPSPGPPAPRAGRLTVTREYLRAERTADRRGRPRFLASPLAPGDAVRVGESILVRLTLHAERALDYLLVEDPRVSGFEIEQLLPEGAEWPWGTHAEERDDRAAFFMERLEEGETVIEYLIRPEIAGAFTALPAAASGMYDPDLLVRSGEARIRVAEK